eukprot:m.56286 g.56286  ORF g.56286 m.56286 type:complete len:720 (+) comp22224_c0_seq1:474-2633(+)
MDAPEVAAPIFKPPPPPPSDDEEGSEMSDQCPAPHFDPPPPDFLPPTLVDTDSESETDGEAPLPPSIPVLEPVTGFQNSPLSRVNLDIHQNHSSSTDTLICAALPEPPNFPSPSLLEERDEPTLSRLFSEASSIMSNDGLGERSMGLEGLCSSLPVVDEAGIVESVTTPASPLEDKLVQGRADNVDVAAWMKNVTPEQTAQDMSNGDSNPTRIARPSQSPPKLPQQQQQPQQYQLQPTQPQKPTLRPSYSAPPPPTQQPRQTQQQDQPLQPQQPSNPLQSQQPPPQSPINNTQPISVSSPSPPLSPTQTISPPMSPSLLANAPQLFDGCAAVLHTFELLKTAGKLGFQLAGGTDGSSVDPLGTTRACERRKSGRFFVKDIVDGGTAHTDGSLMYGDEIVAIGGVPLQGMRHVQAVALMCMPGDTVTLQIARPAQPKVPELVVRRTSGKKKRIRRDRPKTELSPVRPTDKLEALHESNNTLGRSKSFTNHNEAVEMGGAERASRMDTVTRSRLMDLIGIEDGDQPLLDDEMDSEYSDSSGRSTPELATAIPTSPSNASEHEEHNKRTTTPKHKITPPTVATSADCQSPVSSGDPSARRRGWMQKRGGGTKRITSRKTWKRRFFLLKETMLLYYKPEHVLPDESGVVPGATAAGYVNLAYDCKVSIPSSTRLCLEVADRAYFFICDTKEEALAWETDLSRNLQLIIAKTATQFQDAISTTR